ncbi:MAG: FecR family protein [Bacteroidales bacterium]
MEKKDPDIKLNKFLEEEKRFLEDLKSIDLEKNWERFQHSVQAGSARTAMHPVHKKYRFILRIAAAVALLLAVSATLYITMVLPSRQMIQARAEPSHMEITLSEGTQIALNQGAVLGYPERLGRRIRRVILSGEAFFDVSKVKNSRFYVEVGTATVLVTGTQFNIREDASGNIEVSVVEGEVLFYENGRRDQAVRIAAGERSIYQAEWGEFHNEQIGSGNFLFWKTGTLVYKDAPLQVVLEDLERHFNRTIMVKDSGILQNRWNSEYRGLQLDDIIGDLCMYFDLEYTDHNDTLLLERKHP